MRLQPVTQSQRVRQNELLAYCFSTDSVLDCVYIMGPKVGVHYQVTKADITNPVKMPAVGIIVSKSGPTDCVVQVSGVIRGLRKLCSFISPVADNG